MKPFLLVQRAALHAAQLTSVFFLQIAPTVLRMTLRLVAFNFFEREQKNMNYHFCYVQSL